MPALVQSKILRDTESKPPGGLRFALADVADALATGLGSAIVNSARGRAATADAIRKILKDLMPSLLEGEFLRRLMENQRGARMKRAVLINLLSAADVGRARSARLPAEFGESADDDEVLTSEQAAELLHVSRTHVNTLMDSGALGAVVRTAGRHRRVPKAAVLAYREAGKKRQARGLEAMTRASERLGLYDDGLAGIPRRSKR